MVESTHQVVKEIVFDDEYKPLEEIEEKVQESWEVKEVHEAIDSSLSIELTYTSVIDSYVPFPQSSYYIVFELKPREKSLYPNHHSKQSFVDSKYQRFSYLVKLEDYHDQDPYVAMHVTYYGKSCSLISTSPSLLYILNLFSFYYFCFLFFFLFCFCCFMWLRFLHKCGEGQVDLSDSRNSLYLYAEI